MEGCGLVRRSMAALEETIMTLKYYEIALRVS